MIDELAIRLATHKCKPDPRNIARVRLCEARRTVAWVGDVEKYADKYVIPVPADASHATQAWMLSLDAIEIGVIAMAASDAVAAHFAGKPPRYTGVGFIMTFPGIPAMLGIASQFGALPVCHDITRRMLLRRSNIRRAARPLRS